MCDEKRKKLLGRRGAMLLTLGLTYLFIGYSVTVRPVPDLPGVFHLDIPMPVRVGIWWVAGLVACIGAFKRRDKFAWLALYGPPALRIVSYGAGVALWLVSGGTDGTRDAWVFALGQVPLIVTVIICSGWREPEPLDTLPPPPWADEGDR